MSRVELVQLTCDGDRCHASHVGRLGGDLAETRATATDNGWLSDPANDRDWCPDCAEPAVTAAIEETPR